LALTVSLAAVLLVPLVSAAHYDAASVAARWALDFYKANVSPLQGRHMCNFEPTCSQFSRQAINRYGLPTGILMTADRLERCNSYASLYLGGYYQGITDGRMNDPVENHVLFQGGAGRGRRSRGRGQGTGEGIADYSVAASSSLRGRLETASCRMETSQSAVPAGLAFADYLFDKGDYPRAIGEYERFIFQDTVARRQAYAQLMIAESQYRRGDFQTANVAFRDAIGADGYELAYLGLARSLLGLGRTNAARHYALVIHDTALSRPATVVAAWSLYRQYDFAAGAKVMSRFSGDSALGSLQGLDGRSIARCSPVLGAAMSLVIPGLGQTCAGRLGDGVFSFAVVATAAAASYYYWNKPQQDPGHIKFALAAGLGTVFHLGNIYGAAIAGRDFNRLQKRNYLARIEDILRQVCLQPDYRQFLSR
jgi:putative component of membrane protein insertase Oxa1/YidC/SpoIIIJ protein YidD